MSASEAGEHPASVIFCHSQIARSVQLSKLLALNVPDSRAISFAEAFWMGSKSSGSLFGNVGSLETGYAFDALVIGGLSDSYENLTPAEQVERFCYMGETRYIRERYIAGKNVRR